MALIQTDVAANLSMVEKFADKAGDFAISLIVAALILAVTLWASGWAARLIRRGIARSAKGGHPADPTLGLFIASLARYAIVAVGLIAVLQQLGVQTTSILAVFGAASLAIGLAMQGALSNVAAGVMILLFRPYRVGDLIEVGGRTGRVEAVDLFATELTTPDNVKVMAPNSKVFGDVITNFSAHSNRRVDVVFRVDLKRDLPAVLTGLKARAEADPRVLKEPPPTVEVLNMAEVWVEAAVRAWARREDHGAVKSDLMLAARLLADGAELPALPEVKAPVEKPAVKRRRLLRK
jgi:small conductance mechanosensitive channel